jgi:hypothetical protein
MMELSIDNVKLSRAGRKSKRKENTWNIPRGTEIHLGGSERNKWVGGKLTFFKLIIIKHYRHSYTIRWAKQDNGINTSY